MAKTDSTFSQAVHVESEVGLEGGMLGYEPLMCLVDSGQINAFFRSLTKSRCFAQDQMMESIYTQARLRLPLSLDSEVST